MSAVATPTLHAVFASQNISATVSAAPVEDVLFYYTTNGSTPTIGSPTTAPTVTDACTVKCIGMDTGSVLDDSAVASFVVERATIVPVIFPRKTTDLAPGEEVISYAAPIKVLVSIPNNELYGGHSIITSVNGGSTWTDYGASLSLDTGATVAARVKVAGKLSSLPATEVTFVLKVTEPKVTSSQFYHGGSMVAQASTDAATGAVLYGMGDSLGSTPGDGAVSTSWPAGGLLITDKRVVKVKATASGLTTSDIVSRTFTPVAQA